MIGQEFGGTVEALPEDAPLYKPKPAEPTQALAPFTMPSGGNRAPFRGTMPFSAPRTSKFFHLSGLPIAAGTSYGATKGTWYRVNYASPIAGALPVAVSHYRQAQFSTPLAPAIAAVTALRLDHISLPKIDRDDMRYTGYNTVNDSIRDKMGDWGWANWIRDSVAGTAAWVGWFLGAVLNWLWDKFLAPKFDNFNSKIDQAQDALNKGVIDQVNAVLASVQTSVKALQDNINGVIGNLYSGIGMPAGVAISTVQVKDWNDSGFSWLSMGDQSIVWIAVGQK